MLLEDRWSSRPRLGKEGGRKMTELMVVLIEDRLSSRPRLGEEGGRERTEFMVVLLEDRWSSWPRLVEEAGRERTELIKSAAGGQVELQAQAGRGRAGRGHK